MDIKHSLALLADPTRIFKAMGRQCDPWQKDLLFSRDRQVLLNCCRQSGKPTTGAALDRHQPLSAPQLVQRYHPATDTPGMRPGCPRNAPERMGRAVG
jgi:hypothetical protein